MNNYYDCMKRIKRFNIEIGRWKCDCDNDTLLLRCPACGSRYIPDYYFNSVYRYCYYCGQYMLSDQISLFEV